MSKEIDDKTTISLISSIIANQIALYYNEAIQHTTVYKHELKRKLKISNQELIKAEGKDFEPLDDSASSKFTNFVYKVQYTMIQVIAELGIYTFGDIVQILQAYKKNKEVVMWLADKLNDANITQAEMDKLIEEK